MFKTNRRKFFYVGLATLSAVGIGTKFSFFKPLSSLFPTSLFSRKEWKIIAAIQDHLLPSSKDIPGAQDVNALEHLQFVINEKNSVIDQHGRKSLKDGVTKIQELSLKKYQKSFTNLTSSEKENVLRSFEKTHEGYHFLTLILDFSLEALLGDPVYNINPNKIGWKWIGFKPGLPRPLKSKRYFELT